MIMNNFANEGYAKTIVLLMDSAWMVNAHAVLAIL